MSLTTDVAIIFATFMGPIAAVQLQKFMDRRGERSRRQVEVFRALMASRAMPNSPQYVNALNAVPLEFHGNTKIVDAWRDLLMHLNIPQEHPEVWGQQRLRLFIEMLKQVAKALHYDFRDSELQDHVYFPQWQVALMNDQELLRKGLVDLMSGKASLSMKITDLPVDKEMQGKLEENQRMLKEWLEGRRTPGVVINNGK